MTIFVMVGAVLGEGSVLGSCSQEASSECETGEAYVTYYGSGGLSPMQRKHKGDSGFCLGEGVEKAFPEEGKLSLDLDSHKWEKLARQER